MSCSSHLVLILLIASFLQVFVDGMCWFSALVCAPILLLSAVRYYNIYLIEQDNLFCGVVTFFLTSMLIILCHHFLLHL